MIHVNNNEKNGQKKCSIWQLVKNWLNRNDRNYIFRHYSPRILTIPSKKIAKSWKFMILDIIIKTRSGRKCRMSLDETLKTIYRTNLFGIALNK